MTIVKWDPFRNVAALQDRINRIFDESFSRTADVDDDISMSAWKPSVDIYETDEAIILKAELPGIKKEDVSVEIKDNILRVSSLDMLDETPLLDIKPYIPRFDSPKTLKVGWFDKAFGKKKNNLIADDRFIDKEKK